MAAERVRERKFMESEGLVNNRLAAKIGPAQEAVNRMVKAGASLSKDDAAGTVAALDGVKGEGQRTPPTLPAATHWLWTGTVPTGVTAACVTAMDVLLLGAGKIGDALGRLSTTDEAKELVGTVAEGVGAISAAASKVGRAAWLSHMHPSHARSIGLGATPWLSRGRRGTCRQPRRPTSSPSTA